MSDWGPTEPSDIVTVAASDSASSATMLAAWVANATLLGVGGVVDSLQATNAAQAATVARNWRTIGIRIGDGVANVYLRPIPRKRK